MTPNNINDGLSLDDCISISGNIGGHAYVDLGLKSCLKWATYNVGASNPTELGDYFLNSNCKSINYK